MAKDPAFLFYSKDWLEGTMEMTAEEKGVYIDLLAHQHQKGSLPAELKKLAKLAGKSELEFKPIWEEISSKFIANANGRLVNRKLNGIVSERLEKGWRNTIIGTLGAIVRYAVKQEGKNQKIADEAKKTFKVDDFLAVAEEKLTECISDWFSERYIKCYESIANANNTCIKDELGVKGEEKDWNKMPGVEFLKLDLPDLKAGAALELIRLTQGFIPTMDQVYDLWGVFKNQNFTGKKFYDAPDDAFSHFINWSKTQKLNGTHKQQSSKRNSKTSGAYQLLDDVEKDLRTRGASNTGS